MSGPAGEGFRPARKPSTGRPGQDDTASEVLAERPRPVPGWRCT